MTTTFALTSQDRRSLIRLLGKLQTRLEEAIQSAEPAGDPGSAGYLPGEMELLAMDRRDWRAAEVWVKRLEAGR
jgi:hypothetical protein